MPRPWWASEMKKATSASAGSPVRSKRPMPIISSPSISTKATRSVWSTVVKRVSSLAVSADL